MSTPRYPITLLFFALYAAIDSACAQDTAIAFDRPGIAFSPATLGAGKVSFEQGLPDFARDESDGTRVSAYAANSLLRVGLTEGFELQLGAAPFNRLTLRAGSISDSFNGAGDSSVALKYNWNTACTHVCSALLMKATLATGSSEFTVSDNQYSLGSATNWDINGRSLGLYLAVEHQDGDTALALAPSFSFALSENVASYVEAGFNHSDAGTESIAGVGLTWMLSPRVQFDLSSDWGLNDRAPDWIGGVGLSWFFAAD